MSVSSTEPSPVAGFNPITALARGLTSLVSRYLPAPLIFAILLTIIVFGLGISLTQTSPVAMVQMNNIVIAAAARTAVGAFNGGLASIAAHELVAAVIREALRASTEPAEVSEVILGQVLTAG
jgi:hypothetical protein